MDEEPGLKWAIVTGIAGILILLVLIYAANVAAVVTDNETILQIAGFMNTNARWLILMALMFFAAEIIDKLRYPTTLAGPPLNAAASVLAMRLLVAVFDTLNRHMGENVFVIPDAIRILLYIFVFIGVWLFGTIGVWKKAQ